MEELLFQNKSQNSHSPLLTKRKHSQQRGGNSTVRNKNKSHNRAHCINLNTNLRSSSNHNEERKSSER